jgi:glucose-6-phosphate 1-dehydrogenase
VRPGQFKEEEIKHFLDHISYEQGIFNEPLAYTRLSERIHAIDDRWGQCTNKLFHLSVPPHLYEGILTNLAGSRLTESCADGVGWTRILIEKPFGNDIDTAKSLDKLLSKLFKEEQIFRIDHYLAKEALQNILAFRASNAIFESVWNKENIDKVHIKLYEKSGVEDRGAFYDKIGALKDVGQNHILQMLALIAMEHPRSFTPADVRRGRAETLERLMPIPERLVTKYVVRGQYDGYVNETGVAPDSATETFFRIEARLNTPRWKGVPFFLESGKAMSESKTEIDVYFKQKAKKQKMMFFGRDSAPLGIEGQNVLTFRIQPDEGIKIRFFVKTPGYEFKTEPKILKFKYSDVPSFSALPNDYERLLHDAFIGDQTLFASTDEIMASWKYVTPILAGLKKVLLKKYPQGIKEIE